MSLAVIIPTLNEEDWIATAVDSAVTATASEIIVVDAGSTDRTLRIAKAHGARVLLSDPMRARQLNHGAAIADSESLLFLHADSRLPPGAAAAVEKALGAGADFGGFRIAFAEPVRRLKVAALMVNLRTSLTRCPWGDQAQFIRRDRFFAQGGFKEIPLMEDYDLAIRMKRSGHSVLLPLTVTTSGRRFLQRGVLRTAILNWTIVTRFRRGADVEELARLYRS